MSAQSRIEWTDRTWNPTRGCSIVSPGCVNCYAMKMAHRFSGPGGPYNGLTKLTDAGPQWTGDVRPVQYSLREPASWRKPQRIFVDSMSDLFHDAVPDDFVADVFDVMKACPRHTFQILTKRPIRMRDFVRAWAPTVGDGTAVLPNVHLGVSVEDQKRAEERIPILLQTPAAVRFISAEPLLGPLQLRHLDTAPELHLDALTGLETMCEIPAAGPRLDWIIVGGESGSGARPCDVDWIATIIADGHRAGVPVFVKQLGKRARRGGRSLPLRLDSAHGGNPLEWPADVRVRQFPHERRSHHG